MDTVKMPASVGLDLVGVRKEERNEREEMKTGKIILHHHGTRADAKKQEKPEGNYR